MFIFPMFNETYNASNFDRLPLVAGRAVPFNLTVRSQSPSLLSVYQCTLTYLHTRRIDTGPSRLHLSQLALEAVQCVPEIARVVPLCKDSGPCVVRKWRFGRPVPSVETTFTRPNPVGDVTK